MPSLPDRLLQFLSLDYSGLVLALLLLALTWLLLRRRPRMVWHWLLRALALAGVVLAIGAFSHLVRVTRMDSAYPPPGKIVDVGGFDMHVFAEGPGPDGENGLAIVWLPGAHFGALGMWPQHKSVRNEVRSILVDRPGTGWSETGPFPVTTAREADDIVRALEAAGEKGPFIWTGHSFGGLLAANIARRHPDKTAAVVLLDPTPLDVLFYGADKQGLASFYQTYYREGLRRIFGLYRKQPVPPGVTPDKADNGPDSWPEYYFDGKAFEVEMARETRARSSFANGSALKELSAHGLVDRAWDTVVFDGELGDLPLYLVAPGEDPTTLPYAQSVLGDTDEAERFAKFLAATRERFMQASSNSQRVYAPAGTGHNFPAEKPEFVTETLLRVARDVSGSSAISDADYAMLTTDWPGEYGGLPPLTQATPPLIEAAYKRAIKEKRAAIKSIADNPEPATFENTVLALESSGTALRRIDAILRVFTGTHSDADIAALNARLAPLAPELNDETAHNPTLFERVKAVYSGLPGSAPDPRARRLVESVYDSMLRDGAELNPADKTRLATINGKLAELSTQFAQNANADEASLVVFIDNAAGMAGMNETEIAAAKAAAEARGRPESWAIPIARPTVWPFLTKARDRSLREQVWRLWANRGGNAGEHDNGPVMTEILQLRGEKARLLGFDNFADYQTSSRMIGSPEKAMELMNQAWQALLPVAQRDIAELQAIAKSQVEAEGGDFELQPWDRLFYTEKLRQQKFKLDVDAVKPYLTLDNVVDAMFWAAAESFGFAFKELHDVPVIAPGIRVFEVSRKGELLGVLWTDLFQRTGKGPASWAAEYRTAENYQGKVMPLVALHSAATPPLNPGDPVLVPWERANVIFHEFGHALHMLSNGAPYASLGPTTMPWDFIEVPSLLNERWLLDRTVLKKFARHYQTGEPMPDDLIDRIEAVNQYDRVFSANLSFLGTAMVDMQLHSMADGREIDAEAEEQRILKELQLPQAVDLTLYATHAFHTFASPPYAAGVYTYLWSDVLAADIAEEFLASPGGLFDAGVSGRYFDIILAPANTVDAAESFAKFRGRTPDPMALMRRFGLAGKAGD